MKKNILIILVLSFTYLPISMAQKTNSERSIIEINDFSVGESAGILLTEKGIRAAAKFQKGSCIIKKQIIPIEAYPFLAFSITWEAEKWKEETSQIWYRFYESEEQAGDWQVANIDGHADQKNNKWIGELIFESKASKFLDLKINFETGSEANLSNVKLNFYSPGESIKREHQPNNVSQRTVSCPCTQPDFENRQDWCPAGNCPPHPNPMATTVTHLIVHHSAGTNASSDWAGVVRSIWDYHVNTNGWSDIGYNWLVDPNGVLYEGRGDNILGAHFCGTNTATMGVCVMGDFTNINPTLNAKSKLTDLLSWKSCDIEADPLGSSFHSSSGLTLNHISGHKDGCATACPGNTFYPEFGALRTQVKDNIESNCEDSELLAPTNLGATIISSTVIQLDWEDNSPNETSFIIERSINNNSDYQVMGNISADIVIYDDGNLNPNTAYFYRVRAANAQEVSDYSNEVGIATVVTSLEDLNDGLGIFVFPNPVTDILNVKENQLSHRKLTYQIMDYTGKLITENTLNASMQIKMGQLPKGLYILKFSQGEKIQSFKVQRF